MKSAKYHWLLGLCLLLIIIPVGCAKASDSVAQTDQSEINLTLIILPQALTNGRPTLAEFGRGTCIPCKQMKPILESLASEYQGRLNVSIVDVDEYSSLTNYYHILTIPTQVGFDKDGKEVFRHIGLWPKEQIVANLSKLGIH